MESKLWKKLVELGYRDLIANGYDTETRASLINIYYLKYGTLNGCNLVYEGDKKELKEFFLTITEVNDSMISCSGIHLKGFPYFDSYSGFE